MGMSKSLRINNVRSVAGHTCMSSNKENKYELRMFAAETRVMLPTILNSPSPRRFCGSGLMLAAEHSSRARSIAILYVKYQGGGHNLKHRPRAKSAAQQSSTMCSWQRFSSAPL